MTTLQDIRNQLIKSSEYTDNEHLAYATGVIDMSNAMKSKKLEVTVSQTQIKAE